MLDQFQLAGVRITAPGRDAGPSGAGLWHRLAAALALPFIVLLMLTVPPGALAGPPSNYVSAPVTGAAVVTTGSFRNLYLWPDPSRQTWNAHVASVRNRDPQATTTTINAITSALTKSSYFDELSQYDINPPRLVGVDRTVATCVTPALRNAATNHGVIQFPALVSFVKCETALPGNKSAQVNVFISPDLHVSQIGLKGQPDMCSSENAEAANGYHAFFPDTANFTVLPTSVSCNATIADLTEAMSHEMVETISDPGGFGWIHETVPGRFLGGNLEQEYDEGELADICSRVGLHPTPSTPWNAVIPGLKQQLEVAPYWSNADAACEPRYIMNQVLADVVGSSSLPDGSVGLIRMTGSVHSITIPLRARPGTAADELQALELQVTTGGDDLRGGSQADVTLQFNSGAPPLVLHDVNQDQDWGNDSVHSVLLSFPPGIAVGQLSSLTITTHFGGGIAGDNWDIAAVVVKAAVGTHAGCPATPATLVNAVGGTRLPDGSTGLVRMTGSVHSWSTAVSANPGDTNLLVTGLQLLVNTGGDDLRGGNSPNDNANAVLTLTSGAQITYTDINDSGNWANDTTSPAITLPVGALPPNTTLGDISQLTITTNFGGGISGDNWDIADVELQASLGCAYTAPPPIMRTDQLVNAIGGSQLPDGSTGLVRMTGSVHTWSTPVSLQNSADAGIQVSGLELTVTTGGDDLRGGGSPGDNADVVLTLASGNTMTFANINASQDWGNNSVEQVNLLALNSLPAGTTLGDISQLEITTDFGGGLGGDNWDIADVGLTATGIS